MQVDYGPRSSAIWLVRTEQKCRDSREYPCPRICKAMHGQLDVMTNASLISLSMSRQTIRMCLRERWEKRFKCGIRPLPFFFSFLLLFFLWLAPSCGSQELLCSEGVVKEPDRSLDSPLPGHVGRNWIFSRTATRPPGPLFNQKKKSSLYTLIAASLSFLCRLMNEYVCLWLLREPCVCWCKLQGQLVMAWWGYAVEHL